MDALDLSYVAGLFDGEGSVVITSCKRPYGRSEYFSISAQVGMTDESSVRLFQDEWPAHFSIRKRNGGNEFSGYRDLWRWHIERKRAASFLRDIYPYSRLKKNQIDLALELDSMMGPTKKTDSEYQRMVEIRDSVRLLNKRGI